MKGEHESNWFDNMLRYIFNIDAVARGSSNVHERRRKCTIRMKFSCHMILLLFAICPTLTFGEENHLFRNLRSQQRSKWETPCGHRERISEFYSHQLSFSAENGDRTTLSNVIKNVGDMAQCLTSKLLSLKTVYVSKLITLKTLLNYQESITND